MNLKLFFTLVIAGFASFLIAGCSSSETGFKDHSYGKNNNMPNRILVVYGSIAGSTAEVADSIGTTLSKHGILVDVKPVNSVKTLEGYKAVVVGSAIRMGKVLSDIKDFVINNKSELQRIPTAYFVVCMTLKDDTPENRKTADGYLHPLRAEVNPVNVGLFAGKMDYSKLSTFSRFISKSIVSVPEGDFRDWKVIKNWADSLFSKLISQ